MAGCLGGLVTGCAVKIQVLSGLDGVGGLVQPVLSVVPIYGYCAAIFVSLVSVFV